MAYDDLPLFTCPRWGWEKHEKKESAPRNWTKLCFWANVVIILNGWAIIAVSLLR